MLLYQLNQWMEERSSLQNALKSGAEDPALLQTKINQVEEQLYSQAERWKSSIQELPALEFPYEAPYLDEDLSL
jgi:hypothetical protein